VPSSPLRIAALYGVWWAASVVMIAFSKHSNPIIRLARCPHPPAVLSVTSPSFSFSPSHAINAFSPSAATFGARAPQNIHFLKFAVSRCVTADSLAFLSQQKMKILLFMDQKEPWIHNSWLIFIRNTKDEDSYLTNNLNFVFCTTPNLQRLHDSPSCATYK
jgi:hypothetical protein